MEELVGIGYEMKEANFRFETPFKDEKGGFHLITNALDERVQLWEKALDDNGVQVIYNTAAKSLIVENDKICGFTAEKEDGTPSPSMQALSSLHPAASLATATCRRSSCTPAS